MKKIAAGLLVGALAGSMIMANWVPAMASDTLDDTNMVADKAFNYDEGSFNMIDTIKSLKGITEVEKNQLIATENKLEHIWKQVDVIDGQIDEIYDGIFKDINNRYYAVEDAHIDLWNKLYDNMAEEDYDRETSLCIDKSTALTKAEKDLLRADLAEMDALDVEYDALQVKADSACADLMKQADALYAIIDRENEKNQDIWDKVVFTYEPIEDDVIAY